MSERKLVVGVKKIQIGGVNKESDGSSEYAVQEGEGGFKFSRAINVQSGTK